VRERIRQAAERSGRLPEAVRLVAVVKTVPAALVAEAVALGVADLGESRVQEAEAKIAQVGRRAARWHLIGHLQRNKVGRAVGLFDRVHSVDSAELAHALSVRSVTNMESMAPPAAFGVGRPAAAGRGAAPEGGRLRVLVEVNVGGEATKQGVAPGDAGALVEIVAALPGLELDGLMTVGPAAAGPEDARAGFALLRRLRDEIEAATGVRLPELSMGMSGDFEAAIAEGATMVRVGTALFGPRA